MENQVLQVEAVEVFGRGGAARQRTEGDAITQLAFQQSGLEITLVHL